MADKQVKNIQKRLMPNNLEAEQSILASILINSDVANDVIPELKQDEERLIVFVDESRLKSFEKHYPYAQPVLQNKQFAKAIKHIIYFWIDLGSPTDRDFYLNTEFSSYNSYSKKTKIFQKGEFE